ncbi:hypothetical protein ACHHYP_20535 [Achlya hypogyna]|uniref:DDE-1 domain-containing protein n=1 Tax=Achlya hypogyna TaxID=1202772 RepID=A0A1V9YJG2_ACHHY|nr:hypothetical protein ACHHYP_20535 [Achlya hypogyna]
MFIIKGSVGGVIDEKELSSDPPGHAYIVQKKAWMDSRGWDLYLRTIIEPNIEPGSVLLVDNFEAHVSTQSYEYIELHVSMLLDVGVMGPFKAKLRYLWMKNTTVYTTAKEKRMATILRAIEAWEDITPEYIRAAFQKSIPRM